MWVNVIQMRQGKIYLMQRSLVVPLIAAGILLGALLWSLKDLPPLSLPVLIVVAILLFFALLTLWIVITNLYQHRTYGGSIWGVIHPDGMEIVFKHHVEKNFFRWEETEQIIYARRLICRGIHEERGYSHVIVFFDQEQTQRKTGF